MSTYTEAPAQQYYTAAELQWQTKNRRERESALRNIYGMQWFIKGQRSSVMRFEDMSYETQTALAAKYKRTSQRKA